MVDWEVHTPTDEEKAAILREIEQLRAKHPAPCKLFTTTTGKCTCE